MNKLKLLIVEGNTKEENINFNSAGCVPQSQNFKLHIEKLEPNSEIDIVEPGNDKSVSKIISSLKKYDGVVLTGSTLRIADTSEEVKKHIQFAKTCFEHGKNPGEHGRRGHSPRLRGPCILTLASLILKFEVWGLAPQCLISKVPR